ncbi:phage tail assembly protein [Chitiniphilus purpureus]|uniref:Phage tail assembly protein n=1 Tax=Chitiniphilus purpureus TaxID=2981137 RepID=A0ABY6DQR7_9NEIS|nr:phage tail assembly protein [Chitiniphilus sp. CD1]UXY16720.1 phage tail assembly protein [Chitiniphilus sp. CD1]
MSQQTATITLDTALVRGEQTIATLTLRKPNAGELRGISLVELTRLEAGALITLLPRITEPTLLPEEARRLDPADLLQCGTEVTNFLLPKAVKAEFQIA